MEIKVTVAYEAPKTDKFAALMAQYKEVEKLSNETIAYYKPLAEVAEAAKLDAILQQLKPIFDYLRQLNRINQYVTAVYFHTKGVDTKTLEVSIANGENAVYWANYRMTQEKLAANPRVFTTGYNDSYNILGNWDKWQVYAKLEAECIRLLEVELKKQADAAEKEVKRLHNIVGG